MFTTLSVIKEVFYRQSRIGVLLRCSSIFASLAVASAACLMLCLVGMPAASASSASANANSGAANSIGTLANDIQVTSLGASSLQIPFRVPPGIVGAEPQLALSYNSQQPEGVVGLGFSLTGLSAISRCGASQTLDGYIAPVNFDQRDRFCLDGVRLILIKGSYGANNSEYRTETESFARIIAQGACGSGPCSFVLTDKDGTTLNYGSTADSRPLLPGQKVAMAWQLASTTDNNGNQVLVSYRTDPTAAQNLPDKISYNTNPGAGLNKAEREIRFAFEVRNDALPRYMGGQRFLLRERLRSVTTYVNGTAVLSYQFAYRYSVNSGQSWLTEVSACAGSSTNNCLAPTRFEWQEGTPTVRSPNSNSNGNVANAWCNKSSVQQGEGDFNADGRSDLLCVDQSQAYVLVSTGTLAVSPNRQAQGKLNLPALWCDGQDAHVYWSDFNGDRKLDLICAQSQSQSQSQSLAQDKKTEATSKTGAPTNNFFKAMLSTGTDVVSANRRADGLLSTPNSWCPLDQQCQAQVVNFDGDGRADLSCACANGEQRIMRSNGQDVASPNNNANGVVANNYCTGANANKQWGDFNGDGQGDLFCHQGGKHSVLISTGTQLVSPNAQAQGFLRDGWCDAKDDQIGETDFNGDGLSDLSCKTASGAVQVLLSTGREVISPNTNSDGLVRSSWCNKTGDRLDWSDFNGDGLADAFCHGSDGRQLVTVSTGTNLVSGNSSSDGLLLSRWCAGATASVSDFNGDAMADLSCADPTTGTQSIFIHSGDFAGLMNKMSNGIGGSYTFSYKAITDDSIYKPGSAVQYPVAEVRSPMYVVQRMVISDGRANDITTTYNYVGARTDLQRRTWLGFEQQRQTALANGSYTITDYIQNFPVVSFIAKRRQYTANAVILQSTEFVPKVINTYPNVYALMAASEKYSTYTLGKADFVQEKRYEYDAYGNTKLVQDLGSTESTEDDLFDCWIYKNDTIKWRLGLILSHRTTRNYSACNNYLNDPNLAWNGATDLRWDRTDYDANNNPITLGAWDDQNQIWLNQSNEYDPFGNVKAMTDWAGNRTTMTIDDSHNFVKKVTSPMLANNVQLAIEQSIEANFGNVVSQLDANSNEKRFEYDAFGRRSKDYGPDPEGDSGAATVLLATYQYGMDSEGAFMETRERPTWQANDVNQWPFSRLYYDGLARPVKTIHTGPAGGKDVVSEQSYDQLGRLWRTSYARFVGESAFYLTRSYDDLDRVTKMLQPDQVWQKFEYLRGELLVRTTTAKDGEVGRTTLIERSVRDAVIKSTGGNEASVIYQYDPLVQKLSSTGPRGDVTSFAYDSLGRVIRSDSADSGSKLMFYNAQGLLARVETGDGSKTYYEYDQLARVLTQRIVKPNLPEQRFSYQYDASKANNSLGQLAQVNSTESGINPFITEQKFSYTKMGLSAAESLSINGQTYAQRYRYLPAGERSQLVYPDGAILDVQYDLIGNPTRYELRDSETQPARTVADISSYSALNQVRNMRYGNGTLNEFEYYSYDQAMGRPKSSKVSVVATQAAKLLANYQWNNYGQLNQASQQRASRAAENYQFAYNNMGWLTRAEGPYGIQDFAYDSAGNITLKDGVTYRYQDQTNRLQGADNGLTAAHDANGNVTALNWPGSRWTYQYDGAGSLIAAQLNENTATQYKYDFAGNRLQRTDANGDVSIYVSADFDITIRTNDPEKSLYTRYVEGPQGRIAASTVVADSKKRNQIAALAVSMMNTPTMLAAGGVAAFWQAGQDLLSQLMVSVWTPLLVLIVICLILSAQAVRGYQIICAQEQERFGVFAFARALSIPWILASFLLAGWPGVARADLAPGDGLPKPGELYFHLDSLSSTTLLTNADGNETSVVAYLPYGAIDQPRSSGPNDFRPKFAGSEQDPVGLNYMGARYQHPTLGRFLQPDPQNQFTTPYSYVGNDPQSMVDPNGEEAITAIILVTMIVIGAVAGAYSGGSAVNHSINPAHWDWRSGGTYAGIFAGAAIGAAGGAIGGAAAEAGVAAGIVGEIAIGAVEGAAFSAMGGGSPQEIAESFLTGGVLGGVSAGLGAGIGAAVGGAARSGSRMLARGEASLTEDALGEGSSLARAARRGANDAEVSAPNSRAVQTAESSSENSRLLRPDNTDDATPFDVCVAFSFVAGTQIATPSGLRDVSDIGSGDQVLAPDEDGVLRPFTVLERYQRDANAILDLRLQSNDGEHHIFTTAEHPFWVQEQAGSPGGWLEARYLQAGDALQSLDQQPLQVLDVSYITETTRVYNFEVATAHAYYAGDEGKQTLVHNPHSQKKCVSKRDKYMGRTPGKSSKTGKTVIARMRKQGFIRVVGGKNEVAVSVVLGGPRVWKPLDRNIHMGHIVDAVGWWNKTGYKYGARAKQVRVFMLDANNYELEWGPLNSSNGAKLKAQYRDPKN